MGVAAHVGYNDDTSTSSASAAEWELEFLSCDVSSERELIRNEGLRGTRLHPVSRVRQGRLMCGGVLEFEPTYSDMRPGSGFGILRHMIGDEAGVGPYTYSVSDTQPDVFQFIVDKVAKVITYLGARTSRVTFRSSAGQPLSCSWEIEALSESVGAAASFASLTIPNVPPFVWHDAVVTLNGTGYQCMDWEMTLDWALKTDRWVNSQTRTDLPSMDCTVTTRFTVPYTSDTTGLYDLFTESSEVATGVAGSVAFTKSSTSVTFAWTGLLFPMQKIVVPGRDEIVMSLVTEARRPTAGTAPLIITLDPTV